MARDTGPAKLPSLPPLPRDVDPALRRFLQALGERSEVREGSRGNDAERVVLQRDLQALRNSSSEARGWLSKYGSIDALAQAIKATPTFAEVEVKQGQAAAIVQGSGRAGAAAPPAPSVVTPPDLILTRNDLDFWFAPAIQVPSTKSILRLRFTVDLTAFFAAGGDHMPVAINCEGVQGSGNPQYGPVVRNGRNLFSVARGFYLRTDRSVAAEHWNGSANPGTSYIGALPPNVGPVTVTITAGYRDGPMANTMAISITRWADGAMLLNGAVPWGWNYRSTCEATIAIIGPNFKEVLPGQTETYAAGGAPSGWISPAGFTFEAL